MALYDPSLEKDNCGFGLIAHMEGEQSHKLVRTAISALDRMTHRGGIAADGKTGDGCGLLLQKPDSYLRLIAEENGFNLGKQYAVGMIFFNQDPVKAQLAKDIVNKELAQETLTVAGWREVPTNSEVLGPIAANSLPNIQQVFISAPAGWRERDIERRLYIARRRIEKQITEDPDFYICSLSTQVLVYKGLCMPADLPRFYLDLADGSDSSSLDNMLDLFLAGGMDIFRAMRMLVPPAWQNHPDMDPDLRAFYDFNSKHMEPWDGPAGIVLSDGRYAACNLDRNGLRPARYVITKDKLITLASEVGIWNYAPDEVAKKGRVGPGELLVIDTRKGKLWQSSEIDNDLKSRHPYREWMENNVRKLTPFSQLPEDQVGERSFDEDLLKTYQKQFAMSNEEVDQILRVLGDMGQEAVGSMGDDTPMAVLSSKERLVTDYFRQKFAQVTNPPIDPLREKHVMSLATSIGQEMNVFCETDGHAHRVTFDSPVLLYSDMQQLLELSDDHYRNTILDINYDPQQKDLKQAINDLCEQAEQVVREGTVLVVLSDRALVKGKLPIPAAMAVGAVQTRLIDANLRCDANIVVETATARDPHQFAVLL
ncbi:glutamate synthase central domain-containing protein, partial [Vibrio alginolyticus]